MERKVSFYSDGLKISGMLFEPDTAKDRGCPGLVMCQGRAGVKEFFHFPHIARQFVNVGCVVLTFDYRGMGESEGERARLYPMELVEDIQSALTYLEVHPKVDPDRLALYGMSYGGALAPYVAGVDPRVKCAISVAGWGDGEHRTRSVRRHGEWLRLLDRIRQDRRTRVLTGKAEALQLGDDPIEPASSDPEGQRIMKTIPGMQNYKSPGYTLAAIERIIEFKPIEVVARVSPMAILFIAAEKDTVCPCDSVVAMYQRAKEPKKLWLIPDIGHFHVYEEAYLRQVIEMSQDWLCRYVHAAAYSPVPAEQQL